MRQHLKMPGRNNREHPHGEHRVISLHLRHTAEVAQANPGLNQRKSPINGDSPFSNLSNQHNKEVGLPVTNSLLVQPLQVVTRRGSSQGKALDRGNRVSWPAHLKVPREIGRCYAVLVAHKASVS